MNAEELDYLGILPREKESIHDFIRRGEQFLHDAYELKDNLKKDAYSVLKKNSLFIEKKYQYHRGIIDSECRFLDNEADFFRKEYLTSPDWVSVVDADCAYSLGSKKDIHIGESKVPVAIVSRKDSKDADDAGKVKLHEIIHCIRDPVNTHETTIAFIVPWMRFEMSPEEHLVNRLSGRENEHTVLGIEYGLFMGNTYFGAVNYMLALMSSDAFYAFSGTYFVMLGLKFYNSFRNTPKSISAFEKILLSEEKDSENWHDVKYALIRLEPYKIRKIAEKMGDSGSGKGAIIDFLKNRKNLGSKIILEKIS